MDVQTTTTPGVVGSKVVSNQGGNMVRFPSEEETTEI
jgi:hypothetical protein